MVAWGIVMTLMGIVQSYHGLLIARLFLGVTEAGLYPGVACERRSILPCLVMWQCGVMGVAEARPGWMRVMYCPRC